MAWWKKFLAVALLLGLFAHPVPADEPLLRLTTDGQFKRWPAWSPDGQQLLYTVMTETNFTLFLLPQGESEPKRLTDAKDPQYDACWSPDGKKIAYAFDKSSLNQGNIEVYVMQADGSQPTALATHEGLSHEEAPAWSPDGKLVAFTSTRDGNQELYTCEAQGGEWKRWTNDVAIDAHPCWSPDGKKIAFATARWGDLEIAVLTLESGELTRVTDSVGLDDYPAWSPDGKSIAFVSNRDGNFEIYRYDVEHRQVENVTNHPQMDHFPAWTPDGRLTFISNRSRGFDIYVQPPQQPTPSER